MKVSIFFPIYNRSENTKKLLNELTRQQIDYPQTEILAVENGSTEDMSFLDDYKTIRLVHNDIAGVYHAYNIMLTMVTGDYCCFIDNDDWISPNYLKVVYDHIVTNKDWYVWNWYSDDHAVDMGGVDLKHPLKLNWAMWGYCIKSDLFKDIRFNENVITGDDIRVMYQIITEDTEGEYINEYMYHFKWMNNEDSVSHIYNRTHKPCTPETILGIKE